MDNKEIIKYIVDVIGVHYEQINKVITNITKEDINNDETLRKIFQIYMRENLYLLDRLRMDISVSDYYYFDKICSKDFIEAVNKSMTIYNQEKRIKELEQEIKKIKQNGSLSLVDAWDLSIIDNGELYIKGKVEVRIHEEKKRRRSN